MIAIGIDPGTAICGYGIVDLTGNKLKPIHFGAVFTDKDMAPELRLKKIYEEISVLIDTYKPDIMSIEKLFFNRNVTTAIPVGQARGVVLLAAANKNLPILEFMKGTRGDRKQTPGHIHESICSEHHTAKSFV